MSLTQCHQISLLDVALDIVKTYPELGVKNTVLGILARKPDAFPDTNINIILRTIGWGKYLFSKMLIACQLSQDVSSGNGPEDLSQTNVPFPETKSNIIERTIKSAFAFIGLKVGASKRKGNALLLLRCIWDDIAKKPRREIDEILRGPPDPIEQDNETVFGRAIQAKQLQKLISEHVDKMKEESENIISTTLVKVDQVLQLQSFIFESFVKMHSETQNIINGSIKKDNKPLSSIGDQALELQALIFKQISNTHDKTQKIIMYPTEFQALELPKIISEHIDKMSIETKKIIEAKQPAAKEKHSSRILFMAAEKGNTKFIVELIRQYPDLIWKVDDNNQSIFHIAVKHRHEGIYNLLYEIGTMKDLITPLTDGKDNNMLHLVGKSAKQKRLEDVSGVALQMQRELLWFKEVEAMIPPSYGERKNKDGLTPYELFTKEHKDLVTQGEKWMKGTANQCMIVAALIATIVFAAAFTVPGGYDQTTGIPIFHSKATFMVFVVADAISLFASSASILMFLSILTSRYAERDFLESLPKKLMLGLATLFLSIVTMTIAFSVSFFVLYHKGLLWMPITISVFGVLPVFLYMMLQYGLFFDVIRSTYGSRYLFKPKKHLLYYKNPKV